MPDRRKHRGKHPQDDRLFAEPFHGALRTAVRELSWLLTRGYALNASLKLVGDRHRLTARQRMAVRRSACPDDALRRRRESQVPVDRITGERIGIDMYNVLISIESAISGGVILVGRDGCCRDLASIHGTYRKVTETVPAVEILMDFLAACGVAEVWAWLDSPVSNSGRLKALIEDIAHRRALTMDEPQAQSERTPTDEPRARSERTPENRDLRAPAERARTSHPPDWHVALAANPDDVLAAFDGIIVSSDANVLDRCGRWTNLAAAIIDAEISRAWKIDLRGEEG